MNDTKSVTTPRMVFSIRDFLGFLIPSVIGVLVFIIPISHEGRFTIPVAFAASVVLAAVRDHVPAIVTGIINLSAAFSVFGYCAPASRLAPYPFFRQLFKVTRFWTLTRVLGAIFASIVFLRVGPNAIWAEETGTVLLNQLLPILFSVFLFAGSLLPLLLNFGLLEFFGSLTAKFMRPIFTLPGRSAVDCLASWVGDGSIGILLTAKQFEQGYYTEREAAVIATSFSVVSITFSIIVLSYVRLEHMVVPYYLTILIAGMSAAIICPRIPPLSRKSNRYYRSDKDLVDESIPPGHSAWSWGLEEAIRKARLNQSAKEFVKDGAKNVLDMWFGVIPVVMAFGTTALVVAEYTPFFEWLGAPLVPVLELMRIPEAKAAAETIVIGFADMFLPVVIGSNIPNDMTRFIIAAVSVTQLIYMSEVGGLLLGCNIPVSFRDLVVIFIQRTVITLPIITLCAHYVFS